MTAQRGAGGIHTGLPWTQNISAARTRAGRHFVLCRFGYLRLRRPDARGPAGEAVSFSCCCAAGPRWESLLPAWGRKAFLSLGAGSCPRLCRGLKSAGKYGSRIACPAILAEDFGSTNNLLRNMLLLKLKLGITFKKISYLQALEQGCYFLMLVF